MIYKVIRNQLRHNNPPETRETLNRLMAQNIPKDEAMRLIGCVFVNEMYETEKEERMFDVEKYVKALQALPELPRDDD